MFLPNFSVSIVSECEPAVATMENRGRRMNAFSFWGEVPVVAINVLRLKFMAWRLCRNLFLEVWLL